MARVESVADLGDLTGCKRRLRFWSWFRSARDAVTIAPRSTSADSMRVTLGTEISIRRPADAELSLDDARGTIFIAPRIESCFAKERDALIERPTGQAIARYRFLRPETTSAPGLRFEIVDGAAIIRWAKQPDTLFVLFGSRVAKVVGTELAIQADGAADAAWIYVRNGLVVVDGAVVPIGQIASWSGPSASPSFRAGDGQIKADLRFYSETVFRPPLWARRNFLIAAIPTAVVVGILIGRDFRGSPDGSVSIPIPW